SNLHVHIQEFHDKEKKLTEQQFQVRNNREFDAISKEIETIKQQLRDAERDIGIANVTEENLVKILNEQKEDLEFSLTKLNDKEEELVSDYFIVATGARSKELPILPFDQEKILSSKEAMTEKEIPKTLGIIGAGAIGVEFADFYSSMGSKVHIVEYLDHLLPNEDEEISKILERSFKKKGIEFYLSTGITGGEKKKDRIVLKLKEKLENGKSFDLEVDKVIVGVGLTPNTNGIRLEEIGIHLTNGFISVNERYATSVSNIYAIGDCTGHPLLAHVASMEGVRASEAISIQNGNPHKLQFLPINYEYIPGCTYCHPEVASVGMTEKKAKESGLNFKIGRFPFTASGRAQATGDTTGMIKLISGEKGEILGAHIIGPNATELISEYVVSSVSELRVEDIGNTIHAHPTLSEGLMEAALDSMGEAINI
ncbi:MAG: FAD-dependent oxidoreductase, partial [Leptospiraceae bacterium]|nr:FAD-dependent oxidoreductase [Leptospiraceae bacterium]